MKITVGKLKKILESKKDDTPITIEVNDLDHEYTIDNIVNLPKEVVIFVQRK